MEQQNEATTPDTATPSTPVVERPSIETEKGIQFLSNDGNTERPQWLPEKFKSVEDMATAYRELEKRLGGKKPETAPESPADPAPAPSAEQAPEAPQLGEFQKYTDEFTKTGQLSEQSYKELMDRGIPKVLVDNYIANFKTAVSSQTSAVEAQIVASVGGPQEYAAMQVWASNNFGPEEIAAYNKAMESNDPQLMAFAVKGLQTRFKAESEPRLISSASSAKPSGFRSMAELTVAMRDPRYASDPAYRADVANRIKASQLFGVEQ